MTGEHDLPGEGERLPPDLESELAEALRTAYDPAPLDERRHARILEQALEDPFAPASDDELRESERLRKALDEGDSSHPEAALARALAAAVRPEEPSGTARERAEATLRRDPTRPNVVYVSFGALALAAAAGFVLFLATAERSEPQATTARATPLLHSRSTSELFEERFELSETSARIDRIAEARGRDLRHNRYARWGFR